ncbi:MAG: hypothetical protein IPG17_27955 [Sandaracinaceae bacterium]|nr:hypothetical protein [Sandaracinaceae bacterium]
MTPAVLGLLSMLGCAEATVQRVDASADSATADVRQAALATWRALDDAAETPGTYWYAPDCDDSCDTGFHVVRWGHGVFEGDATTDEECAP